MNTFFQFVMYQIFGKKWVLYDMREGLRMAIFVNEAEIAMIRNKIRKFQDDKKSLESELADLKTHDPLEGLPEGEGKAYYDAKKVRMDGHEEAMAHLERQIGAQNDNVSGTDGELQRIYNIAYHNRIKFDFVKSYNPKKSYADDGHEKN